MICRQWLKRITRTHLLKHNLTTAAYKAEFPGTPIVCGALAHKLGAPSREMPPERRHKIGKAFQKLMTGRPKSADHRLKLSKARSGVSWGHHTHEHREHMRHISKDRMSERTARGWKPPKKTEQQKATCAKRALESWASGTRKKMVPGHSNRDRKLNLTPEQRANRARRRVEWMAKNATPNANTSIEIEMKKFLTACDMDYVHQFIVHEKGSWAFDFFIPALGLLVEVDGEYYHTRTMGNVTRDIIKGKIAESLGYEFLRISDKNWCPTMVFATRASMVAHNEKLIRRRLTKFRPSDLQEE